MAKYTQIF